MQAQPNFNFRGIKLTDGMHQATEKILCNRCFHPVCDNYAAMSCVDFTPALKFKPPLRGFDNENFNSFRIGTAWAKRLAPGSLVAIVNSKTNETFGHAEVIEVHTGEKSEMAKLHGEFNHTMLALNVHDNIVEMMLKRLKTTSGSMIYNSNDHVSVIYMRMMTNGKKEKNLGA